LFSVFYFLKVYISKGFLYNKLTSKLNFWNILAISLILTLIPLVFNIYNNYTNYPLPIKGYLAISDQSRNLFYNNTNIPLWVMCFNERGERDYILNKDITCHVNITYKENYTFYLHEIDLTYFLKDDSQYTKQIPINNNSIQNLTQFFNFLVYINETFDQALIQFNFIDTNNNLVKVSSLWIYPPERILTEEQYFTKREQSLSLIIGLFSLLIFSIISAIKNFKDL
ncbi:MAG: hypothetical protein NT139_00455, partial [Candidatus Woesearchaeota archaeon]|nr:hypothetical protein [Candidatus Woesearchaeota archaeon]